MPMTNRVPDWLTPVALTYIVLSLGAALHGAADICLERRRESTIATEPRASGGSSGSPSSVTTTSPARRMPELRPGDEVLAETVGATYTYELDTDPRELVIPFTGVWVLDRVPKNPEAGGPQPEQRKGQRLITMTTCSELFHTDDRMISFGHLVKTEPKPS